MYEYVIRYKCMFVFVTANTVFLLFVGKLLVVVLLAVPQRKASGKTRCTVVGEERWLHAYFPSTVYLYVGRRPRRAILTALIYTCTR